MEIQLKEQFSYTQIESKLYNKFPKSITKYAFPMVKKVSAYIDLPGISKVRKEDNMK